MEPAASRIGIPRTASRRHLLYWLSLALLVVCSGCQRFRETALLTPVRLNACPMPIQDQWDVWARQHIQSGDIVFRLGDARMALGLMDLSTFAANLTASEYSHTGIAAVEDGRVWVYDITRAEGVRRVPFSVYVCDSNRPFGVRRPRPEYQHRVPAVLSYCRQSYKERVPFDQQFLMDNDAMYCAELTETAYRQAGIPLSEPVRICDLPNYTVHSAEIQVMRMVSRLSPEQQLYIPGNDQIGLWSSSKLETVYMGRTPLEVPFYRGTDYQTPLPPAPPVASL